MANPEDADVRPSGTQLPTMRPNSWRATPDDDYIWPFPITKVFVETGGAIYFEDVHGHVDHVTLPNNGVLSGMGWRKIRATSTTASGILVMG